MWLLLGGDEGDSLDFYGLHCVFTCQPQDACSNPNLVGLVMLDV